MSQLTFFEFQTPHARVLPTLHQMGYGRARLWLGITAVGTIVTFASLGLICGVSDHFQRLADSSPWGTETILLTFTLSYATIQLPFDIIGGYLLPRRFNRLHPTLLEFFIGLIRGVTAHALTLFVIAIAIYLAGRYGGLPLTVATSVVMMWLLLLGRYQLASIISPLKLRIAEGTLSPTGESLPIVYVENRDEGFTGGVAGFFKPNSLVIPFKWCEALKPAELEFVSRRRSIAIETGSWQRGRAAAMGFTVTGVTIACFLAGKHRLGTVGGTIDLSFWFTLWSFIGLLVLPTLSRRSVIAIDQLAAVGGADSNVMKSTTRRLDELQDGEGQRPGFVEAIFHPIPSVENRLRPSSKHVNSGFWDVARTSVYLSLSGLSLLGRAVHCNCGRPSLWVFLPVD
ncbi:MAG: hypothetical protein WCH39_13960 [Schlesneria sp.]